MAVEDLFIVQKQISFQSYKNLKQIEKALKGFHVINDSKIQISVLGRFPKINGKAILESEIQINNLYYFWKGLLGPDIQYGGFENPEIGNVFVVGPLTSIFLSKINGKNLGNMSTCIYGVLRGLGANKSEAKKYIQTLSNNEYLLVLRGFDPTNKYTNNF